MLTEEDTKRGFKGRPLADIVAGTSIGAINSAVLALEIQLPSNRLQKWY
jgi:predicted acylesterase/phospholipase RssA